MPSTTFSIFLDEDISPKAAPDSSLTSSRKCRTSSDSSAPATKENVNPLTGLSFNSQPPLKKRKPSSSSALKAKPLPSSSKITSKSKRFLSSNNNSKDKGKKRAVLGSSGSRNTGGCTIGLDTSEAEQLQTALGNRRAYDFTVMPLANVTQAYDESEAIRAFTQADLRPMNDDPSSIDMLIDEVAEEVRDPMEENHCNTFTHFPSLLLNCAMRHPRKQYQNQLLSRQKRNTPTNRLHLFSSVLRYITHPTPFSYTYHLAYALVVSLTSIGTLETSLSILVLQFLMMPCPLV